MRRVLLAIAVAGGALLGTANQAEALHHVIRARCINYYPGLYSYGYCGAPCPPPYTFPCAWSYPKYCGPWAGCYDGRVQCGVKRHCGLGLCHRGWKHFAGLGCGLGYGLCGSRCCGSAACGYGYCGGSCASLSCGGSGCDSGCMSGNCDAGSSTSTPGGGSFQSGDEKILYDGPAENAPKLNHDASPTPEPDASTGIQRSPFRLASITEPQGDGVNDFNRGMRSYRDGDMTAALEGFEAAVNAEPRNALYAYYRALAMFNLQGAEAANDWLAQAVDMEREKPIAGWGKRMERVQGRARLWVEQARANAGIR